LTSIIGEHFVDAFRNRIGEAMRRGCYSSLALRHQLLSQNIPLPLSVKESFTGTADDVNSLVF
jgi:hypothetical protein